MLRSSLIAAGVGVLCASAAAQNVMQPRAINAPIRDRGTIDWATGTWRKAGAQSANLAGATVIYNNTCNWTGGAFFAGGAGTCFDWWDDGRIPSLDPMDPTLATTGLANSYTVCGWTFGYCSSEIVPQSFFMSFSGGTVSNGVGGQCGGPFAPLGNNGSTQTANAFLISGLPGSATLDINSCWLITIDLTNSPNAFSINGNDTTMYGDGSDNFAYSWRLGVASVAPTNPTGQFLAGEPSLTAGAGTFDIPSATDPISGGPCGNGMDLAGLDNGDLFWINTDNPNTCGGPASGCYFFGGWPGNPAGGFYLTLSGIQEGQDVSTYCTAKPSDALGCTAAMSASGSAGPVSGANDFSITVTGADGFKPGIFFGGINGQASLPFLGGTLCFFPPIKRGGIHFTGGTNGQCDGTYSEVVNNGTLFPNGFDAGPGGSSWMQAWYRSPCGGCSTGFDIGLSNGLEILNWQ